MAGIEDYIEGDTKYGDKSQTLNCVGTFREATNNEGREQASTPESKQLSPGKSVSSEDTRDSAASSVDSKEEDFLPASIRERRYSEIYEEADKQLWEDLREEDKKRRKKGASFLEQAFIKYIFIDVVTRQAYVKMPTDYHEEVVRALRSAINSQSTQARPVLADSSGGMDLTNRSRKYPDIFIHGQDRTKYDKFGELRQRKYGFDDGRMKPMNPNAIIEVSWTNPIRDELAKFALQMNKYKNSDELGVVNVGYLIKFIPRDRGEYPNDNEPARPLVGINIYRMERTQPGQMIATLRPGETFCEWRHGQPYPENLQVTGQILGQGPQGGGVSIPFEAIVDALHEELGVRFETPGEN